MNTFIFYFVCILSVGYSTDYYDLLGISKDADNREIRKAFKKLALKLHPDKTQEKDENAHEKFIAINKAYEVLKDENTRKKYDLYGEEGLKEDFGKSWKGNYHSWNYYSESFGIYDDDPEIITLNRHDFVHSVLESSVLWFVNFYSPQCSHCHHLAPAWRELARELKDVIQIGAVNCEEDWMLCRQQNVHSYPSLILYPRRAKYSGSRDAESMIDYILQLLPDKVIKLTSDSFNEITSKNLAFSKPWLIFVCSDLKSCFDKNALKKLSLILDNLINVVEVNSKYDPEICSKINCRLHVSYYKNLYSDRVNDESKELEFLEFEFSTFIKKVYELLEGPIEITEEAYNKIREGKSSNETLNPWLIEFRKTKTRTSEIDTEMKRLKSNLPEVSLGFFDCEKYPLVCSSLYIKKFPTLILFKTGWGYEIFHGTITVHDVIQFTKEALLSKVETLTPKDFPSVIESGETWFIDYFAPWCPPCMELLPLFRKVSHSTNHIVKFGSVDCATHVTLCRQYNINSYPTTILYNQSVPHRYSGSHMEQSIRDFVEDILNPSVVSLTPSSFTSLVQNKEKGVIWIVDFFAPWCGPCQQMAPHWRKLAKMLHGISYLKVGAVDCEAHYSLCNSMGIRSYPTIHLYPMDSAGISRIFTYNGRNRDAVSLQGWVYDFLPSKVESLTSSSYKNVLSDKNPWIIDFFAPWCSHCQTFAPEFEKIAEAVEGKVKTGKINCDRFPDSCRLAGVRAYPTVLFYEGNEGHATQNPIGMEVETLTFKGVYSFLEQRLGLNAFKKETLRDEL